MGYSCQKRKENCGVTKFVAEIRCPEDHPKSDKSGLTTEYGYSACLWRNFIDPWVEIFSAIIGQVDL